MQAPVDRKSLWFATALLPAGWTDRVRITTQAGLIESIATNSPANANDEQHAVAIAGSGNVHSHAFQRAMAGLAESRQGHDNFWSWRDLMYRFVGKLDPDQVEAIAAQAFMEMLECGITRVGEFHYLHHAPDGRPYTQVDELAQRLCSAAATTGIGMTLLPVFYAHGGVGGQPPDPSQSRFINSLDSFWRLLEASRAAVGKLGHGRTGIAAHSLRAVMPQELHQLAAMCPDGPIHIHIAEQQDEVRQWQELTARRPVDWLLDNMAVDRRWCLVHATHVSASEVERLTTCGATVGLCPITEANLGDGIFPARNYLSMGGSFGIGTDSNVLIDYAEELRMLEYGQRLIHRERNLLGVEAGKSTGRTLFDRALAGSANALCGDSGRLAQGCIADIVALSTAQASLPRRGEDALLDSWIFAGASIDSVWSAGRRIVSAGRHHAREAISSRYAAVLNNLLE